jgi:hypothetical protein
MTKDRAPSPTTEEKRILDSKDKLSKMSKEYNELVDELKSLLEKKQNTLLAKVPSYERKESALSTKKTMIQSRQDQVEHRFEEAQLRADKLRDNLIEEATNKYKKLVQFAEDQHQRMIDKATREYNDKKGTVEIKDKSLDLELSIIDKHKEILSPALQKQLYDAWKRMKSLRDVMCLQVSQQKLNYPIPDLPEKPCDPPDIPEVKEMKSPEMMDFFATLGNENAITEEQRRRHLEEERRWREDAEREDRERMMAKAAEAKRIDQEEKRRRQEANRRRMEEEQSLIEENEEEEKEEEPPKEEPTRMYNLPPSLRNVFGSNTSVIKKKPRMITLG